MRRLRRTAVPTAALVALLAGACGGSRAPVYDLRDVDQQPELLGCPADELGVGPRVVVRLALVVDEDGRVVSSRRTLSRTRPGDDPTNQGVSPNRALVDRAREIARGCTYSPAILNGMPVRTRLVRDFTFAYTPDYHAEPMGGRPAPPTSSPPDSLR